MTTTEINVLLAIRRLTIQQLSRDIREDRSAISHTINYLRRNDRIRKKLADRLGLPVEELFNPELPVSKGTQKTAVA